MFVKLLRRRVWSFVFTPCLLVTTPASLLLTLSWPLPRLAFATAASVVCTRAHVLSVTCKYEGLASLYAGCGDVIPSWLHKLHFQMR